MRKKNILINISFILIFVVLWFFSGWNSYNYDFDNYSLRYDLIKDNGFSLLSLDFGYDLIQYIFIKLGASFIQFRIIVYGIGLAVILRLIYKWSFNPLLVLLLYICYHYIRDVVETRNFIASLFLIVTIYFYGKEGFKYKIYIALLLLASFSIHMAFVLCAVFILTEWKKWDYWVLYLSCAFLSFFASNFLSSTSGNVLFLFEGMENKVDAFASGTTQYGLYVALLLALGNGICIVYAHKALLKGSGVNIPIRHLSMGHYSRIMLGINALSSVFLILTPIHVTFYMRLFGDLLLLNFIYFLNVIFVTKKRRDVLVLMFIVYYIVFLLFTQMSPFNEHLEHVLNNNILING